MQQAYDLLVHGRGAHHAADGPSAVRAAYERGETDEFVTATTVGDEARIRPGDSVIAFNFRPDRMREITLRAGRSGLRARSTAAARRRSTRYACMTEYQEGWPYPVAFPPERPAVTLARRARGARRDASCTSPRRRSTRT